jgi:hypothetical protein
MTLYWLIPQLERPTGQKSYMAIPGSRPRLNEVRCVRFLVATSNERSAERPLEVRTSRERSRLRSISVRASRA